MRNLFLKDLPDHSLLPTHNDVGSHAFNLDLSEDHFFWSTSSDGDVRLTSRRFNCSVDEVNSYALLDKEELVLWKDDEVSNKLKEFWTGNTIYTSFGGVETQYKSFSSTQSLVYYVEQFINENMHKYLSFDDIEFYSFVLFGKEKFAVKCGSALLMFQYTLPKHDWDGDVLQREVNMW